MNNNSPPANVIDAIAIGIVQVLAPGFEALGLLIVATLIAGPALATMALLWLEQRVTAVATLKLANAAAAIVLTFASFYAFAWAATVLDGIVGPEVYQWTLPTAFMLAAAAIALQIRARKSLSTSRATGVICAILVPLALIAMDGLF
jgi:hypothetical protein